MPLQPNPIDVSLQSQTPQGFGAGPLGIGTSSSGFSITPETDTSPSASSYGGSDTTPGSGQLFNTGSSTLNYILNSILPGTSQANSAYDLIENQNPTTASDIMSLASGALLPVGGIIPMILSNLLGLGSFFSANGLGTLTDILGLNTTPQDTSGMSAIQSPANQQWMPGAVEVNALPDIGSSPSYSSGALNQAQGVSAALGFGMDPSSGFYFGIDPTYAMNPSGQGGPGGAGG